MVQAIAQKEPIGLSLSGSRTKAVIMANIKTTASFTIILGIPKGPENKIEVSMIPPTTTLKLIKKQPIIQAASITFP